MREKFTELARKVAEATGEAPRSPEDVAQGLRIAVENMANAIKKISVQRGHDVTRYTLQCFGGAGGQHDCGVADALGMTRVLVHPYAGVLSAYGMGLAPITAMKEAQIDPPLADYARAMETVEALSRETLAEVEAQGGTDGTATHRLHLRYDGSHQAIPVEGSTEATAREMFEAAHKRRYGFISPGRDILIDMASVESNGAARDDIALTPPEGDGAPLAHVPVYHEGDWRDVPIHSRETLNAGAAIKGPAIITEPTGTNVIEPGWTARLDTRANLVIERHEALRGEVAKTEADPILLEVMSNLFMSVADQMGATLANTSWSVNIKERLDFSCAIFDAKGDLVANAPHVPVHLGSMSDSVKTIMRLNPDARPGDAFMLNSPYNGGTHLPDVTVITPLFDGDTPVIWLGSRGHHADIGGRTPGSGPPDSTHIEEEGVLIDNVQLVRGGDFLEAEAEAVLRSGRYPCRNVAQNMADLKAQVAANETGKQALSGVIETYGLDVVRAYMGHVQDNAEAAVRRVVDKLSDGEFRYPMDHGAEIAFKVTVDRETREAVIDFTGTSPQHSGNYNAPRSICDAVVLYVFRTLVGADIPLNQGCLKPLRIIVPEGSMLNPVYPAAVIAGDTEVS